MTRDQIVTSIANDSKSLLAYAYKLCNDKEVASDLLQEMYLTVLNYDITKLKDIHANGKQHILCAKIIKYNWFAIAKNQKKKQQVELDNPIEPEQPFIAVEVQINQARQILGQTLWSLDKFDRTIFYLYAVDKTPIRKLADKTKINRGIIYKSLCQSRNQIKASLNDQQKQLLKQSLSLRF